MSVTDRAPLCVRKTALAVSDDLTSSLFSLMKSVFTPGFPSAAAW